MNLNEQQVEILQACASVDEVIVKLGEWGIVLGEAEQASLRALADFSELNLDELESVSGACGTSDDRGEYSHTGNCPGCGTREHSIERGSTYRYELFHCNECNLDWYKE